MTTTSWADLGLSVTAGGTLQPSLPFVAATAGSCMNEGAEGERHCFSFVAAIQCAFYVCACMSVFSCMVSLCPLLYMRKGQKLSGWKGEDAVDLINMDGLLCGCVCVLCVIEHMRVAH